MKKTTFYLVSNTQKNLSHPRYRTAKKHFYSIKGLLLHSAVELIGTWSRHFTNSYLDTKDTLKYYRYAGPVEVGVQGVPRHTQYLALYLVKTKFIP